jgi:hypothetical protein
MKKQSLALIISILIVSVGISQPFKTDSTITCIPNAQLKQAVALIEEGKVAKKEVTALNDKILLLQKQIDNQDSIMYYQQKREANYIININKNAQIINNLNYQIGNLKEENAIIKKERKKFKRQRWLFAILASALGITLTQL